MTAAHDPIGPVPPDVGESAIADKDRVWSWLAFGLLGGGIASIVGSVLPWVTFAGNSLSGVYRDGVVTLPLAAIVVGVAVALLAGRRGGKRTRRAPVVGAGVSAVVCVIAAVDILDIAGSVVAVGPGLLLVAAGSLIATVAGGLLVRAAPSGRGRSRGSAARFFQRRNPHAVAVAFVAFMLLLSHEAPAAAQSGTYGAWVFAPGEGVVVFGLSDTANGAVTAGVLACHARGGGRDCHARAWFRSAYSTFAQSAADPEVYGVGWADSADAADSFAIDACVGTGHGHCSITARAVTADPTSPDGAVYNAEPSYGAWAYSAETAKVAAGRGGTLSAAKSAAKLAACGGDPGGAGDCPLVAWFENGYSTFAQASDRSGAWGIGWDDSPAAADSTALAECKKVASGRCDITARSETSDPWSARGDVYQVRPSYGVWAISASTGISAAAVATKRAQAERDATTTCRRRGGGSDCTAAAWFRNGYSTLAKASNGRWTVSAAWTRPAAEQLALHKCPEKGPDCQIVNRAVTLDPWFAQMGWIKEPVPPVTPSTPEPPIPRPVSTPPQKKQLAYVALGDSYSSGEGLGHLSQGCHRSGTWAYPVLLAPRLRDMPMTFVACTGAVTDDITTDQSGPNTDAGKETNFGEGRQITHLNGDTKVVTITISGDDVGFSDVLGKCIQGPGATGHWGCMTGGDDSELYKAVLARINLLDGSSNVMAATPDLRPIHPLNLVLNKIGLAARPDTRIYIGTYPKLFGTKTTLATLPADDTRYRQTPWQVCEVADVPLYSIAEDDITQINRLTDRVNEAIRTAVDKANSEDQEKDGIKGKRFHVAEADKMFADHGICDKRNSWINNLSVGPGKIPSGWCCLGPNARSFHPTQVGQCAYEDAFELAIAKNQPQIMATDRSKSPAGCERERDAQRARLKDYGGKIRDRLLTLAATMP